MNSTGAVSTLLLALLVAGSAQSEAAWSPPIGIPAPPFGVTQSVNGLYGSDSYRTKTVSGGGDLNTKLPTLAPGDVVVIEAGIYSVQGGTWWTHAGTAAQPIIVRGAPGAVKPVIRIAKAQDCLYLNGAYAIYENLDIDLSLVSGLCVVLTGHHIALRDSEVRGATGARNTALYLAGGYNVVLNSKIHDNGPLDGIGDPDYHGMGASGHHQWILDNQIYRNGGDGVQINAGNATAARSTHHIYIGRNDAWANRQSGFWVKFCEDIILSQNRTHGHRSSTSSSGQGMGFQYGTERAWFLFNVIYDNEEGILIAADGGPGGYGNGQHAYIVGNVIHDIQRQAILSWETSARKHAIHNTIYRASTGIDFFNAVYGTTVQNNVFAAITGADLNLNSNKGGTFSHNFCDGAACVTVDAACLKCVTGVAGFTRIEGADGVRGNADDDFSLLPGSAAIDRGTLSDVYQTFQTLYGISISADAAGRPRPAGAAWDIGAYEAQTASLPPPLPIPSNVRVLH